MKYEKYIDNTLLKADATKEDIIKLCNESIKFNFKSVCINPSFVSLAHELLKDSEVLVCTVIGFPLGANTTETKVFETENAIKNGTDEIDMVINIGWLKDKQYDNLLNEIKSIKSVCKDKILKVIIEACLLTDQEKVKICQISEQAGADFVKTSTGFSLHGATVHDVSLMRNSVSEKVQVKASGGIKTHEQMLDMISAGATRIGTSNGTKLI